MTEVSYNNLGDGVEVTETNSMENRYLVLNGVPEEDPFEEEMLLYNTIPGLLPMETGRLSGVKYHRYKTNGFKSLRQQLQGKQISGECFEDMFKQIFAIIKGAREYLLREDGFWISPESIFLDEENRIRLCYYPEYHCLLINQLKTLSEWLLGYLDPNDETAVYNGYALHVLCHGEACSFQAISAVLEEKPALPEIEPWTEEEEEQQKPRRSNRKRWALFGGGAMLLAWIGALLLWVMH
ncbi:MAG: DUF6382 domain-containing protein [Lachnospiraceae bacterium]|nr:DUF6382 domain-containing protein [Lachnospiraceae bacterium]